MGLRLKLDQESVDALRQLSFAMPAISDSIEESTGLLLQTYYSVEEQVGPHREEFSEMMNCIQKAQINITDALDILPPMLEKVASQIEDYIAFKGSTL